jgi:hypothetical protein
MKKLLFYCIPAMLFLSACRNDMPEPEVKKEKEASVYAPVNLQVVQASKKVANKEEDIRVHHTVRGNNVYVECKVSTVSFRKDSSKKTGKILLEIDGKDRREFSSAAFVVGNLKPGTHKMKLSVVSHANETYHIEKKFTVKIP